ncbi:MAG: protein-L-isoaspartate(D-aspartate) O-methyltransferase [Candidatus Firestonebacteria bacterium]|nr:protein-L-isoaspartate(D-aspartate) O-methyltransferase [Candidatus Firestonebacteria bacterium]
MDYTTLRNKMVDEQIIGRGIKDEAVISAMRKIPRHFFVNEPLTIRSYGDYPLPIIESQTISQPFMVALMTELLSLNSSCNVLEIGTGSGYQTAILAEISEKVYTIERYKTMVLKARELFNKLNYHNIVMKTGDGTLGWKEFSPFDRILVTAGAPTVPEKLVNQLADCGRMIIPIGDSTLQKLTCIEKKDGKIFISEYGGCVFVPLVGKYGWKEKEK